MVVELQVPGHPGWENDSMPAGRSYGTISGGSASSNYLETLDSSAGSPSRHFFSILRS